MGKKIDGFVLSAAAACLFYFYFLRAFESRTAAIVLAMLCWWTSGKILKRGRRMLQDCAWLRKRRIRRHAEGTLIHLAGLEQNRAREAISDLLQRVYSGEYETEIVQLHPSMNLPEERLFELWRKHKGKERLAVCATCRCDSQCRTLASTLKQPKITVVDAAVLSQLIAEHPEGLYRAEETGQRRKLKLRHLASMLFNRKNAPRCLLISVSMLVFYLFGGNIWYLCTALVLLFIGMVSLRKTGRPAKLF